MAASLIALVGSSVKGRQHRAMWWDAPAFCHRAASLGAIPVHPLAVRMVKPRFLHSAAVAAPATLKVTIVLRRL